MSLLLEILVTVVVVELMHGKKKTSGRVCAKNAGGGGFALGVFAGHYSI